MIIEREKSNTMMYSNEEINEIKEWLKDYDENNYSCYDGFEDLSLLGFLDEYGERLDRELKEFDTYKGWFYFRAIYKILDRFFACEYNESYCDKEVERFYEVYPVEYEKTIRAVEWHEK